MCQIYKSSPMLSIKWDEHEEIIIKLPFEKLN